MDKSVQLSKCTQSILLQCYTHNGAETILVLWILLIILLIYWIVTDSLLSGYRKHCIPQFEIVFLLSVSSGENIKSRLT